MITTCNREQSQNAFLFSRHMAWLIIGMKLHIEYSNASLSYLSVLNFLHFYKDWCSLFLDKKTFLIHSLFILEYENYYMPFSVLLINLRGNNYLLPNYYKIQSLSRLVVKYTRVYFQFVLPHTPLCSQNQSNIIN